MVQISMHMGSFKLRLVGYFILLALLPLLASSWAFNQVASRSEVGDADARLNAALRVAVGEYAQSVEREAAQTASSLARATSVQLALASRDRAALVRLSRDVPNAAFYSNSGLLAGEPPQGVVAERSATVFAPSGEVLGRVAVWLSLDNALLRRLGAGAGLDPADRFVLASAGEIVAGPEALVGERDLTGERPRYVTLGGTSYRALSAPILSGGPNVTLLALTPKSEIDAAVGDLRRRFLLFASLALALVALVAYVVGRSIVRSVNELTDAAGAVARGEFERRVSVRGSDEFAALGQRFNEMAAQLAGRRAELEAERGRVRDAVARFGEALAATHDPFALLPVIVESMVQATGAAGGRLVIDGRELARAGEPERGARPLEIPLVAESGEETLLLLSPDGADFSDEARELAHWLGSQALVALENVRLHRLVERQASTDGLTDLSNRRQFEEALAAEIQRAERFGGSLALVLADLDDFKQVNDRYGHQAGDKVLRTFAAVLRETVREIDLPARYGGEEFAVLLPQTDVAGAERVAERLRHALAARPMRTRPEALVAVTASFGVAAFPDAPTPSALFAAADEALYRAKSAGKNCVMCAGPDEVLPTAR